MAGHWFVARSKEPFTPSEYPDATQNNWRDAKTMALVQLSSNAENPEILRVSRREVENGQIPTAGISWPYARSIAVVRGNGRTFREYTNIVFVYYHKFKI